MPEDRNMRITIGRQRIKEILPASITARKEFVQNATYHTFRHDEIGDLGSIVINEMPDGKLHMAVLILGDENDPMTKVREELFGDLAIQIIDIMNYALGGDSEIVDDLNKLNIPKQPCELIESKIFPCDRCGEYVAIIYFTNTREKLTKSDFEDFYRKIYTEVQQRNIPAWIIGSPVDPEATLEADTLTQTMKVWPERSDIYLSTANNFNPELDDLMENHCR